MVFAAQVEMKRSPIRRKPHKINRESPNVIPTLKRKLWKLISKTVRERDNWTCITCGKVATDEDRGMVDGGHYKPEGIYKSVQFDLINVNCQCRGCNRYHHGRYGDYAEALIKKYGIEEFNALIERSRKTKSWTEKELLTLIVAIGNPNNYMRIHNQLLNQL
jgi:hypothetical protein